MTSSAKSLPRPWRVAAAKAAEVRHEPYLALSCHRSVMPAEMLAHLAPVSGGTYVDGTFGGGGWSRAILQSTDTKVIGIDRDPQALARAQEWADAFAGRLTLVSGRFGQMGQVLREMGVTQVDGVTLDLGLSSDQLDEAARGFSFQRTALWICGWKVPRARVPAQRTWSTPCPRPSLWP